jgi:hypothetical protein
MRYTLTTYLALILAAVFGCRDHHLPSKAFHANRMITGTSNFPPVVDPELVGEYSSLAKSGAGHFFDEVLEYRVWLCPAEGAERLSGGDDYFFAFATYENALAFSKDQRG